MDIQELMRVESEQRDPEWLRKSLQAAIELEHATLPPYFCALWSIKEPERDAPVYRDIRSIAMDEMYHMGLACNMLVAIGGVPRIDARDFIPEYPCPLPGRVRSGLTVRLEGLTRGYIKDVLMERPGGQGNYGPSFRYIPKEERPALGPASLAMTAHS